MRAGFRRLPNVHQSQPDLESEAMEDKNSPQRGSVERFVTTTHSRSSRFTTQRHRELQSYFCQGGNQSPSSLFLCHLLTEIRTNTLTECWCVGVRDAGTRDDGSAWIKYNFGDSEMTIGLRVDASVIRANNEALKQYASELAAFEIGEPGISLVNANMVGDVYWLSIDS